MLVAEVRMLVVVRRLLELGHRLVRAGGRARVARGFSGRSRLVPVPAGVTGAGGEGVVAALATLLGRVVAHVSRRGFESSPLMARVAVSESEVRPVRSAKVCRPAGDLLSLGSLISPTPML